MNVSFNGFGENILTFEFQGDLSVGDPVMIVSSGTVQKASGKFCGICTGVRNGYASVQVSGYARASYTTAPAVGYSKISAENGKINADSSNGREYLVIDTDSSEKTFGFIL